MKASFAGCLNVLMGELSTLRKLDTLNQRQSAAGGAKIRRLTKGQLYLLTEALFFSAFRTYEHFLRNTFLLYCTSRQSTKRGMAQPYLRPRTTLHAEELIQSSMHFLDWGNPDILIQRAETYLKDGYPVKAAIASHIEALRDLKRVRNHIAHMSKESVVEYMKTLKRHFSVIPIRVPRPGEYLLLPSRSALGSYYLIEYFDLIQEVARQMV